MNITTHDEATMRRAMDLLAQVPAAHYSAAMDEVTRLCLMDLPDAECWARAVAYLSALMQRAHFLALEEK